MLAISLFVLYNYKLLVEQSLYVYVALSFGCFIILLILVQEKKRG